MRTTAARLTLFLMLITGSSCGYLDHDLFTDEESFDESFSTGGIGLSGVGTSGWGCGGRGYYSRRHLRVPRVRLATQRAIELEAMSIRAMSDQQILENTEIGVIDETPAPTAEASLPAQAYYQQKAKRDRAILETY